MDGLVLCLQRVDVIRVVVTSSIDGTNLSHISICREEASLVALTWSIRRQRRRADPPGFRREKGGSVRVRDLNLEVVVSVFGGIQGLFRGRTVGWLAHQHVEDRARLGHHGAVPAKQVVQPAR